MLAIKLKQIGKKHQKSFRVVVAEKRSKVRGNYVEDLGFWNPREKKMSVNKERALYWIGVGATPTDTVHNVLVKTGVIDAPKKAVHDVNAHNKALTDKVKKAEEAKQAAEEAKKAAAEAKAEAEKKAAEPETTAEAITEETPAEAETTEEAPTE